MRRSKSKLTAERVDRDTATLEHIGQDRYNLICSAQSTIRFAISHEKDCLHRTIAARMAVKELLDASE